MRAVGYAPSVNGPLHLLVFFWMCPNVSGQSQSEPYPPSLHPRSCILSGSLSMFRKLLTPLLCLGMVATAAAQGPEKIDEAMNAKIRDEGMNRSKVMWIEHFFTDVYGPRPIGSPNHKAAADWAVKTMQSWGMTAHLEPFTWRGVGWLPGRAVGYVTAPIKWNLKFESNPWSPGTKGTVKGNVVSIMAPVNPTEAELQAYLMEMAPKVKGGIVMIGKPAAVAVSFNPTASRMPDSSAKARYQGGDMGGGRGGAGRGGAGRGGAGAPTPPAAGQLSAQEVNARITAMVRDNMPALRLNYQGAGRIPGEIVAQNGAGQIYDDVTPQPATVILRNDDAGRIWRIIQDGTPVTVELNMENTFYPEGKTSYVTVGEIPGTDKADEVVMMGGHLDSWTSATGATDNGIGSAIMMEAARILTTTGAKPRRTIRVALWSGEEEGELGSTWYVKEHFGSAEEPKPDYYKFQGYWNIDGGTGLVRGAQVFGPPEAGTVVAQILKPFEDFKIYGAIASSQRVAGSSDHGPFFVAGLPGIDGNQDQIEYGTTTWHSNLDTYERIIPDDVMKNATISASLMWHIANRDAPMPRFTKETMPAIPAGRGGGGFAPGAGAAATGPTAQPHIFVVSKAKPAIVVAPGLVTAPRPGETALTVAVGTKPTKGTLLLKTDGAFTYTPRAGAVGTDTFTYTVSRDGATSTPATVTIIIK
jgi:carboxypeptidase Q